MNITINDVLYVVLTVCVPFLVSTVCRYISQKYKGSLYEEAVEAVLDAVQNTNQTYVNELKAAGTFDEAAQAAARQKTIDLALKTMSAVTIKYLNQLCGSAEEFILAKLEASIALDKKGVTTV